MKPSSQSALFIAATSLVGCFPADESIESAAVEQQAGVSVAYVDGNPTCADLGYGYEGKLDSPSAGETQIALPGGNTATFTVAGNRKSVTSWSSTVPLDAMIVKAGDGANVYTYDPEASDGGPLASPENDGGNVATISHLNFCFDFELAVSKTAQTSFTRDHEWSILKTASHSELLLSLGQVFESATPCS